MFASQKRSTPETIGFFLVPKFSMIAFTSAIEPLRMANRMSGEDLYRWVLISKDGGSVTASNAISVEPHTAMDAVNKGGDGLTVPSIAVVSGIEAERYKDRDVFAWLRRQDRKGADIGALCTGSHVLARAGLLDGYGCTIHWENLPGFREEFPDIEVTDDLFAIDRSRFTCSGGMAALDMMLHLVARQHGSKLATQVSEQCIVDRMRGGEDHQRMPVGVRLGIHHPKLLDAIRLMEANLEEPLSQAELARSSKNSLQSSVVQSSSGVIRSTMPALCRRRESSISSAGFRSASRIKSVASTPRRTPFSPAAPERSWRFHRSAGSIIGKSGWRPEHRWVPFEGSRVAMKTPPGSPWTRRHFLPRQERCRWQADKSKRRFRKHLASFAMKSESPPAAKNPLAARMRLRGGTLRFSWQGSARSGPLNR